MSEFNYPERLRKSTLVSEEGVRFLAEQEGVDPNLICTLAARWAESAPKTEDSYSSLVRCDLILRSDGSAVYLDGAMGMDSMKLASQHVRGETNPNNLPWHEWAESVTEMPRPLE